MTLDVQSPRPVRPSKRALEDIDPDCVPARKRHRLLSPTSSPTPPSIHDWLLEIPPPSSSPSQLKSVKRLKRAVDDFDLDCAPASKLRRPLLLTLSPVAHSLSGTPRPRSCPPSAPACISSRGTLAIIGKSLYSPPSLETINQMSQQHGQSLRPASSASSQNSRPSTSSPVYRSMIYNNGIIMDYRGKRIPQELRDVVSTRILKQRSSPPLAQESVQETMDMAEDLADSAEGTVSKLIGTPMFPVQRHGIGEGGNTLWSNEAMPYNPVYLQPLRLPKPDFHYGYASGQRSDWTEKEAAVIDHQTARPYTQPARGNTFPFLAIEMKSEAAGGTLWHAENQAAGSGSHCVNALLWLLKQASPSETPSLTDAVAFTSAVTHRQILFYIHWYSKEDRRFYMSYLKSYSPMDPADVQGCHNIVKNILDYGLATRRTTIRNALELLFPFPEHWNMSRSADAVESTPATSFTAEDTRPSKSLRT